MPSSAGVRLDMLLLGAEVVPEDVAPLFTIRPQPLLNVVIEFSVLLTIQREILGGWQGRKKE